MSYQEWVSLISPSTIQGTGPGATLNTAATATLSPVTGASADVAQVNVEGAFQGWQTGMLIRCLGRGYITTVATSGTLTFLIASRVGNAGSTYVTVATTGNITTGTTVLTGLQWQLDALIRCTNVATSGSTLVAQGNLWVMNNVTGMSLNAATNGVALMACMPAQTGEATSAVDTTQIQGISLRCTQATSTCTVVCTQWLVEALN